MERSKGKRSIVGGVLLLVAMALLIVGLLVSWYTISYSQGGPSGSSGSANFSPDGQVTVAQGGQSVSESLANSNSDATANLYNAVEATLILGLLCAAAGGALGITAAFRPNLRRWAVLLSILVVILAIIGPVVLAVEQPSAFNSDSHGSLGLTGPGGSSNVSSPDNSFFGSQSAHNDSISWGPGIGWYLAFVAAGLAIVGTILTGTARGDPSLEAGTAADSPTTAPEDDGNPAPMTVGSAEGYVCTKCGTRFNDVAEFQKHLREVH